MGLRTGVISLVAAALLALPGAAAAQAGGTYVALGDSYVAGRRKWVQGVVPTSPAAPVHPNLLGMVAASNLVTPRLLAP